MLPQSEDRSDDCPPRSEEWSTFLGKVGRFCNKLRNHNETGWHLPGFIMRKWDAGQVGWQVWSLWLRSQLAVAHWEHTCITGPPLWNCNVLTTSAGSFEPFLLRTSLPSYACLSQHNTNVPFYQNSAVICFIRSTLYFIKTCSPHTILILYAHFPNPVPTSRGKDRVQCIRR